MEPLLHIEDLGRRIYLFIEQEHTVQLVYLMI